MRRVLALCLSLPLLLAACGGPAEDGGLTPADDTQTTTGAATTSGTDEGLGDDDTRTPQAGVSREPDLEVALVDVDGQEVGTVAMTDLDGAIEVEVVVEGLAPGFRGFHVHETGLCEPDSAAPDDPATTGAFLSAGGHLAQPGQQHAGHAGDMPSLHVLADGSGHLVTRTDGFTLADLQDADGSAVMVHEGPDNFANVPERYAPQGPDEDTLATGDSGGRAACAVVE